MHHPPSVTRGVTIKNSIKAVLAAFALLGVTGTAQAATIYSDVDVINHLVTPFKPYASTFNIVNPDETVTYTYGNTTYTTEGGYVPGTQLFSATASFFVRDDAYDPRLLPFEKATFHLGVFGETGFEWTLPKQTAVITVGASTLSLFLDLQTNGKILYTVTGLGDFHLEAAILEVHAVDRPTAGGPIAGVPDGGATLVLMGLGLIGLVAVQSRLTRQSA